MTTIDRLAAVQTPPSPTAGATSAVVREGEGRNSNVTIGNGTLPLSAEVNFEASMNNAIANASSSSVLDGNGTEGVDGAEAVQPVSNPILGVIKPSALVIGETHNLGAGIGNLESLNFLQLLQGRPGPQGGNFALVGLDSGNFTYFGALASPLPGFSLVTSANSDGVEGGVGFATKVPTPAGDLLLFINARGSNDAPIKDQFSEGYTGALSINLGVAYSISDGAALLSTGGVPGGAFVGKALVDASGFDGWLGVAYRAEATFKEGNLEGLSISGVDVPLDRIAEIFGADPDAEVPGADIPGNALEIGSNLYNAWISGGAAPLDAAAWTQAAYDRGGLAGVTEKAVEVIGQNVPTDFNGDAIVTDGAFRKLGVGNAASDVAKEAYDALRSENNPEGYNPTEAWSAVWSVYLDGYDQGSGAGQTGVRDGGNAGGLAALQDFLFDINAENEANNPFNQKGLEVPIK